MGTFEPIARRKLSHDVFDRLLSRINAGEFVAGDYLPSERELMHSLKVGRPAVREAMQTLQRMGLITITHGERARVVAPTARSVLDQIAGTARHILTTTPESLPHLKDARIFFELGMVRMAAARADENAHREPQATAGRTGSGGKGLYRLPAGRCRISPGDRGGRWQSDLCCGQRRVARLAFGIPCRNLRKLGREEQTLSEHRLIVDRIAAHDVDGSAAAMLAHLTRANDLYRTAETKAEGGGSSRKRQGRSAA